MTSMQTALALTALLTIGAAPRTNSAATPGSHPILAPQMDSTLADRITYRLDTDSILHKYDVQASVNGGVATLTGTVATAAQKTQAVRLARITGISRVDDQITVDRTVDQTLLDKTKAGMSKTGEAITDTWITTKVKYHLMGDSLLKDSSISVTTTDHVVTLSGTVPTVAGRARAMLLTKQTDGAVRVVDQMTIGPKR